MNAFSPNCSSNRSFDYIYSWVLQYLGISCLSKNRYYDMIELVYPHVTDILDEMCEEAKEQMKEMDDEQLGSWARAVVTSDGVWHTRGSL